MADYKVVHTVISNPNREFAESGWIVSDEWLGDSKDRHLYYGSIREATREEMAADRERQRLVVEQLAKLPEGVAPANAWAYVASGLGLASTADPKGPAAPIENQSDEAKEADAAKAALAATPVLTPAQQDYSLRRAVAEAPSDARARSGSVTLPADRSPARAESAPERR